MSKYELHVGLPFGHEHLWQILETYSAHFKRTDILEATASHAPWANFTDHDVPGGLSVLATARFPDACRMLTAFDDLGSRFRDSSEVRIEAEEVLFSFSNGTASAFTPERPSLDPAGILLKNVRLIPDVPVGKKNEPNP